MKPLVALTSLKQVCAGLFLVLLSLSSLPPSKTTSTLNKSWSSDPPFWIPKYYYIVALDSYLANSVYVVVPKLTLLWVA